MPRRRRRRWLQSHGRTSSGRDWRKLRRYSAQRRDEGGRYGRRNDYQLRVCDWPGSLGHRSELRGDNRGIDKHGVVLGDCNVEFDGRENGLCHRNCCWAIATFDFGFARVPNGPAEEQGQVL